MSKDKGNLSINSENFLPIIKKWLYTDKDIFVRELVSNACDAVTKLQKLMAMGEADNVPADEKFRVDITVNTDEKTIIISDNGIGMTADEVKKYINQIAFSGAADFLAKYEEKTDDNGDIIGHFGLGFYSAFMVSDRVEIDTLSYIDGSEPAKWSCEGGIEYEMEQGSRTERGTSITLHIGEDGKEFLNEGVMYSALRKYCAFMPVEIYIDFKTGDEEKAEEEKTSAVHVSSEEEALEAVEELKGEKEETEDEPKPLNDVSPLWLKNASECTDEDYKEFYHKVFATSFADPLFWIHLNMDYPFRLKGILYFPKLNNEMDAMEGEVKLYSNQVYIADNIKEVVPEFLLLLKGVIDCPDLPLNVSRSALQNDGYAAKMSSYITKKVSDKLNKLFKDSRAEYEKFWPDISIFIKYGCMKEDKFFDKVKDSVLFKNSEGKLETLTEYLDAAKEKHENKVFYYTDENQQIQYINLFKEQGIGAIDLSAPIDKPFVNFLEYKNSGIKLQRIDSDISDALKADGEEPAESSEEMQNLFRGILGNDKLTVKTEKLKAENVSSIMLLSEEKRRMQEFAEAYAHDESMKNIFAGAQAEQTLVLNSGNRLIRLLMDIKGEEGRKDDVELICRQVYDLALMSHKTLSPDEMTRFIERSNIILEKLAQM